MCSPGVALVLQAGIGRYPSAPLPGAPCRARSAPCHRPHSIIVYRAHSIQSHTIELCTARSFILAVQPKRFSLHSVPHLLRTWPHPVASCYTTPPLPRLPSGRHIRWRILLLKVTYHHQATVFKNNRTGCNCTVLAHFFAALCQAPASPVLCWPCPPVLVCTYLYIPGQPPNQPT